MKPTGINSCNQIHSANELTLSYKAKCVKTNNVKSGESNLYYLQTSQFVAGYKETSSKLVYFTQVNHYQ